MLEYLKKKHQKFISSCFPLEISLQLATKKTRINNSDFISKDTRNPLAIKKVSFNSCISNAVISFSQFFEKKTPVDIYTSSSTISFQEWDPEFKNIMREEFSNASTKLLNRMSNSFK